MKSSHRGRKQWPRPQIDLRWNQFRQMDQRICGEITEAVACFAWCEKGWERSRISGQGGVARDLSNISHKSVTYHLQLRFVGGVVAKKTIDKSTAAHGQLLLRTIVDCEQERSLLRLGEKLQDFYRFGQGNSCGRQEWHECAHFEIAPCFAVAQVKCSVRAEASIGDEWLESTVRLNEQLQILCYLLGVAEAVSFIWSCTFLVQLCTRVFTQVYTCLHAELKEQIGFRRKLLIYILTFTSSTCFNGKYWGWMKPCWGCKRVHKKHCSTSDDWWFSSFTGARKKWLWSVYN